MHPTRFDAWSRSLAALPRRSALRLIGTSSLALLLVHGSGRAGVAKSKCKGKKKRCGKKCVGRTACCKDADCPKGWECVRHVCRILRGSCPANAVTCLAAFPTCGAGDGCRCSPTKGSNRCGTTAGAGGSVCGDCNDDADCRAAGFGADAFCVIGQACCASPGVGSCAVSCVACIGANDCPTGCLCGDAPQQEAGRCVVKKGACGKACEIHADCARTEACVGVPGCTGLTCRRRCGA
jgi:hypothetical protein